MDLSLLIQFFIYMTSINLVIYLLSLFSFIYMRKKLFNCYLKFTNPNKKENVNFEMIVLGWLGVYELHILLFNIIPLISLSLMIS